MDGDKILVIGSKRYKAIPRPHGWWPFGRGEPQIDWVLQEPDKNAEARAWRQRAARKLG